MKFKKGCEPSNVFKYPEDAEKWALMHNIDAERSSALDMFVIDPHCFVDFTIGQAQMIVSYKVNDVTDKHKAEGFPGNTSVKQAEYFSVFIAPVQAERRINAFAFQ
ncbi:MAG: hypothetical protein P8J32_07130 [bacterium]|nr:hypothetical protein [bacterium]